MIKHPPVNSEKKSESLSCPKMLLSTLDIPSEVTADPTLPTKSELKVHGKTSLGRNYYQQHYTFPDYGSAWNAYAYGVKDDPDIPMGGEIEIYGWELEVKFRFSKSADDVLWKGKKLTNKEKIAKLMKMLQWIVNDGDVCKEQQ